MEFVFSNCLVCDDAEAAKRVTFDRGVLTKSVTKDGDVYDPSGVLSGGAAPQSGGILIKSQEMKTLDSKLQNIRGQLETLQIKLSELRRQYAAVEVLQADREMVAYAVESLDQQIANSNAVPMQATMEQMKTDIESLEANAAKAHQRSLQASEEVSRLEKEMKEFKLNRGGKIEGIKADIVVQKKAMVALTTEMNNRSKANQQASFELGNICLTYIFSKHLTCSQIH